MSQLKALVVMRHGKYNEVTGCINPEGEEGVRSTARQLATRFFGQKIYVISSPVDRAVMSADVFCKPFGLSPTDIHLDQNLIFRGLDGLSEGQTKELIELVLDSAKLNKAEVVVLITHLEIVDEFPHLWAEHHEFYCPKVEGTGYAVARVVQMLPRKMFYEIRP